MAYRQSAVIGHLRVWAAAQPRIKRLILFGSRARGDAREESDFDLAFELTPGEGDPLGAFSEWIDDSPPSLHTFDRVDVSQVSEALRHNILSEGKIVYER